MQHRYTEAKGYVITLYYIIILEFWQHLISKFYQMFDRVTWMPKHVIQREFQKEILSKRNCGDYTKK